MIELQPPSLKDSQVEIDVPHDNSCLYWAAALAYLLPTFDDHSFQERFIKLFGETEIAQQEHVKNLIKAYNPFSCTKLFEDHKVNRLVRETFRGRICKFMSENRTDFEEFFASENKRESTFDDYLARMHSPKAWGGDLEIRAMSFLLNW